MRRHCRCVCAPSLNLTVDSYLVVPECASGGYDGDALLDAADDLVGELSRARAGVSTGTRSMSSALDSICSHRTTVDAAVIGDLGELNLVFVGLPNAPSEPKNDDPRCLPRLSECGDSLPTEPD